MTDGRFSYALIGYRDTEIKRSGDWRGRHLMKSVTTTVEGS